MKKFTILMMTVCLCASTALFAASGSWNMAGGGDWNVAGNWVGSTIADGAGSVAYFTNIANSTISVGTRTIGEIRTDNGAEWWLSNGPLTLDNSGSAPIVDVTAGTIIMNCALAGSSGFDKTGAGWLKLYNSTISGDINLNGGFLGLMWSDSIMNADVKVNNGTYLCVNDGVTANGKSVTVNNGGLLTPVNFSALGSPATASLNAPLTCNYPEANTFAVGLVYDNAVLSLNSNITLAANTGFSSDGNGCILNINAPISGTGYLKLMGRPATDKLGTFNINAPCTYDGWTYLEAWGANPRIELGVNQAFPIGGFDTELRLQIDNSSADTSVTLDMNDYTQKVSRLVIILSGAQTGHSAEIAGSAAGVIEVTNVLWTTSVAGTTFSLTGGKIICNGPSLNLGMPLTIANATFLNNGSWGGSSSASFILQSGGKIGGTGFLGWDGGDSANLVIPSGATITPGQSIGTVGCWNLEMLNGSEYDWEVGNTTADLVDVRGGLDISAGGITVNVIDAGSPNGTLTLFTTVDGITGDPATDITMNYGTGVAGSAAYLSGNNVVADIIPEPATLGLLSLLALAFLRRK